MSQEKDPSLFDRIFDEMQERLIAQRWDDAKARFPDLSDDDLKLKIKKEHEEEVERKMDLMLKRGEFRAKFFDEALEKYVDDLHILFQAGFSPIKVTTMMLEYTFIFKTKEEAEAGFNRFEKDRDDSRDPEAVIGWWYGEEAFYKAKEEYEAEMSQLYGEPYRIRIIEIDDELRQRIMDFQYPDELKH